MTSRLLQTRITSQPLNLTGPGPMVVLVPSRGRPASITRLAAALGETCRAPVHLMIRLDEDDPARLAYTRAIEAYPGDMLRPDRLAAIHVFAGERNGLAASTNELADRLMNIRAAEGAMVPFRPEHVASLGDDHVPETVGWDVRLRERSRSLLGWAYGNDLLQGARLPTAWVAHMQTVIALGWVCLPEVRHWYVDNAVLELGRMTGRISYSPGVVIEHLHHFAAKAEVDESYAQSGDVDRVRADQRAYERWRYGEQFTRACERLVALGLSDDRVTVPRETLAEQEPTPIADQLAEQAREQSLPPSTEMPESTEERL